MRVFVLLLQCRASQPRRRRLERRRAEICLLLEFFIWFDHRTVVWLVSCQSFSLSLWRGQLSLRSHPSRSCGAGQQIGGQCSLPGACYVCIPTDLVDRGLTRIWLHMNRESIAFLFPHTLYPVPRWHLATPTLWCSAQNMGDFSIREHPAGLKPSPSALRWRRCSSLQQLGKSVEKSKRSSGAFSSLIPASH